VALLRVGVAHGDIVCVEPSFLGKKRWRDLAADERFWVYKRDTCRGCGESLEHTLMNQRSVYICRAEQRRLDRSPSRQPRPLRRTPRVQHHA
jgi:hypothetical protein